MYTLRSACVTVTLVFLCASRQAAVMTSRHRMGQGGEGARAGHGTGSGGPPLLSHMGRSRNGPQPLSSGSGSGWEAPPSSHHCCRMHSCYALPLCIPFSALSTFCCKSPPPSFSMCVFSRALSLAHPALFIIIVPHCFDWLRVSESALCLQLVSIQWSFLMCSSLFIEVHN